MRLVQHKKEAYWFYRFLSVFYDKLVNPLFWTPRMRDECQVLANLDSPGLKVVDDRVTIRVQYMLDPGPAEGRFDLIWSLETTADSSAAVAQFWSEMIRSALTWRGLAG